VLLFLFVAMNHFSFDSYFPPADSWGASSTMATPSNFFGVEHQLLDLI
jgi:hypothetical protein